MKFTLNPKEVWSHLVLEDHAIATQISKTDEWVNDETLTAELKVNGVTLDPNILQKVLEKWYSSMEREVGMFDLQKTAKEIADKNIIELLDDIDNKVYDLFDEIHNNLRCTLWGIIEDIKNKNNK